MLLCAPLHLQFQREQQSAISQAGTGFSGTQMCLREPANQTRVGMGWNLGCKLGLSRLMLMNSALYLDRCLKCVSHLVVSDSLQLTLIRHLSTYTSIKL